LLAILHDDEIYFEAVHLSPSLTAGDYSAEAASDRLRDELRSIVLISESTHPTVPSGIVKHSLAETLAAIANLDETMHDLKALVGDRRHDLVVEMREEGSGLRLEAHLLVRPAGPFFSLQRNSSDRNFDEALVVVAKWVMRQVDPLTLMQYEYVVGRAYGDLSKAWAELDNCLDFYGSDTRPVIENLTGMMHVSDGDFGAAEGAFRRALRADPALVEAEINLALVRAMQGDREGAELMLSGIAERRKGGFWASTDKLRAAALALKGVIADSRNEAELAIASVREAVVADPELAEAHELAAAVLRDRGLATLALYHQREAQRLRMHSPAKLPYAFLYLDTLRKLLPPDLASVDASSSVPAGDGIDEGELMRADRAAPFLHLAKVN
jgi:hypothetical protein